MGRPFEFFSDITQAIGDTPIVRINGIDHGGEAMLYGKLECMNPFLSVKDRTALYLIRAAESEGLLRPGDRIVESTSGNLGHSLAAICAALGYRLTCVVDSKMPPINKAILSAMGAEFEYVDERDAIGSTQPARLRRARELGAQPGCINFNQFDNPLSADAHYASTGPEIYETMGDALDVLVGCVGTGGHLCGTSRYLKERLPDLVTIAVEPVGSVIFGGSYAPTKQYGVGLSFIPGNYDPTVVDHEMKCSDELALSTMRHIALTDGLLLGSSSGSVLAMAAKYASETTRPVNILCLLPDGGIKYVERFYQ